MSKSNIFCTKVGLQKDYGWPKEGTHKCYNIDCENIIQCVPLNGSLCSDCCEKFRCQCYECEKMRMKPFGSPLSSMATGGHLPGHDFDGDELNRLIGGDYQIRKPSLTPDSLKKSFNGVKPLTYKELTAAKKSYNPYNDPNYFDHEIRPFGMQKTRSIIPKEDNVEKLLMSDTKDNISQRSETKANFKQFEKSRTKAKNPNNRTSQDSKK